MDTISPEQAQHYEQMLGRKPTEIEVPAREINEVLSAHLPRGQKIDLLNIDIEGVDYAVLSAMDFERYRPEFICVEIHDFDVERIADFPTYALLRSRGYKLVGFCRLTGIFRLES